MSDYKAFEKKRSVKQFLVAPLFIVILAAGWFYPWLGFFIPLCMFLGIGIAFFRGRKWCDWFCPRGSFYDSLIKPVSPQKKIPSLFKDMRFRLAVLVVLMLAMTVNLMVRWPYAEKIGAFFVLLLTVTTALGVVLAVIFHQRSWCSFCPIGTVINLMSKTTFPLKIDSQLCIECKACGSVCPIQIAPYKFKKDGIEIIQDSDCLKCNLCIAACPKKALAR